MYVPSLGCIFPCGSLFQQINILVNEMQVDKMFVVKILECKQNVGIKYVGKQNDGR
jgi:hypothetical protein